MSLDTLVSHHIGARFRGRLEPREVERPARAKAVAKETAVTLPEHSMWMLEGAVALASIVTALLIGLGR